MKKWKCGKPLLNRELDVIKDGTVVWTVMWRDGRKYWDEPHTIYRKGDGSFDLWNTDDPYPGYGEYFVSDMNVGLDEQAARDTREGLYLFHAVQES